MDPSIPTSFRMPSLVHDLFMHSLRKQQANPDVGGHLFASIFHEEHLLEVSLFQPWGDPMPRPYLRASVWKDIGSGLLRVAAWDRIPASEGLQIEGVQIVRDTETVLVPHLWEFGQWHDEAGFVEVRMSEKLARIARRAA